MEKKYVSYEFPVDGLSIAKKVVFEIPCEVTRDE
jgi:hypothetical protein